MYLLTLQGISSTEVSTGCGKFEPKHDVGGSLEAVRCDAVTPHLHYFPLNQSIFLKKESQPRQFSLGGDVP